VLVNELVIDALGGRTAQQALDEGAPTAQVWLELCGATEVPPDRWYGRGREPARPR